MKVLAFLTDGFETVEALAVIDKKSEYRCRHCINYW